jgi:alcohol dehydrogenase, propanol-preferring
MKAVHYREQGRGAEIVTAPAPEAGPGQVLLKVTAAGLCHSDLAVMAMAERERPLMLPLALGHEAVGEIAELGAGVTGLAVGDAVAVYGPWGCGRCRTCALGKENYCPHARRLGIRPFGLGSGGGLAEYAIIDDPRHLVPLEGLDPVAAVPMTDAGLTPYHALKRSLRKLVPGSAAVVIGVGGLGHIAVQLLARLTPARVIAIDISPDRLELARRGGAHECIPSDGQAARRVRELTGSQGATVVLDLVGSPATASLAGRCAAPEGDVAIVGLGGGALPVGFGAVAPGVSVTSPYWGSRSELIEVLALARSGAVHAQVQRFSLEETPHAYELLRQGRIEGRAVILPHG